MMRMTLDCRRSNLWFYRPPHVKLVTGEGLAILEVETGEIGDDAGPWLGQADVKDAFHCLGMPSFSRGILAFLGVRQRS